MTAAFYKRSTRIQGNWQTRRISFRNSSNRTDTLQQSQKAAAKTHQWAHSFPVFTSCLHDRTYGAWVLRKPWQSGSAKGTALSWDVRILPINKKAVRTALSYFLLIHYLHSPEKCYRKQAQSFLCTATWKMQSYLCGKNATRVRQEYI